MAFSNHVFDTQPF